VCAPTEPQFGRIGAKSLSSQLDTDFEWFALAPGACVGTAQPKCRTVEVDGLPHRGAEDQGNNQQRDDGHATTLPVAPVRVLA
jgi:hypothetical protein